MQPSISFYIPQKFWPNYFPATSDENWAGFGLGIYAWTVQTYLKLHESGVPCRLTNHIPATGIILCHANVARDVEILPSCQRILICFKAESVLSPQAQLHVVQNLGESALGCHFIPHWSQPGLLPRRAERQDKFETVAFFGHQNSLAPELHSPQWQTQLEQRGLRWLSVINGNPWNDATSIDNRWNDYQDVDVIVAIRQFNLSRPGYRSKPATKLYNAWLAGVPAILGRESAYCTEGYGGSDYLEANSMEQLLNCLDLLQQNLTLRQALVNNGKNRADDYTPAAITQCWQQFLENVAIPEYYRWCELSPRQRQVKLWQTKLWHYRDRTRRKLLRSQY